jgi:hypothetical protein
MEKMNSMFLDAVKDDKLRKESVAVGLVYFFAVSFGAAADKSTVLWNMWRLFTDIIAHQPDKVDIAGIADALNDTIKLEGPLFFGVNYDEDGIFYPWQDLRKEVVRHNEAVRALLQDASPDLLAQHLDAILFFSDIRVEPRQDGHPDRLFAYQIEYRIVQWALIRAWAQDSGTVLELLDRIVDYGQAFNIDFALGIVEHALFRISGADRDLLTKSRMKMTGWIERFESRFAEFYLSLSQKDPFSFNLVPLAVLARVEAQFFTAESGVIPCVSKWLADPSPNRRKMALLAANWLSQVFPAKVLTTLEPTVDGNSLDDWYDRVLAGYEKHSPRLLEEFFNKIHFPTRRRTRIRTLDVAQTAGDVQYQCESFFAWLFLQDQSRLRELGIVYDMIYTAPSSPEFCLELLRLWIDRSAVPVN